MLRQVWRFSSFLPRSVVVTAARRTPFGSFREAVHELSAVQLGSIAIKETLLESSLAPEDIDEVVIGNLFQTGNRQNPARQAALGGGLPHSVVCTTVYKVCASGMKAITYATQGIGLGVNSTAIAGGIESVSRIPYLLLNYRTGHTMLNTQIHDALYYDGVDCPFTNMTVVASAEKTNEKYGVTRAMQDDYAISSYRRTNDAWARGFYKQEVAVIELSEKGSVWKVAQDEEYTKVQYEKIPTLKPEVGENGTITPANASKFIDGAAAVVLMNEDLAKEKGLKPLARILSFADAETEPLHFQIAPSMAIEKALKYANLNLSQIDLFEINETFSSTALLNMQLLHLPREKVNVNGGAVALGHPMSASGVRIIGTLAYSLQERHLKYGVAAICNGGGGGTAVVLEVVSE